MTILFILFITFFSIPVLAYTDYKNNVVSYDKKWTIAFTQDVDVKILNNLQLQKDNIMVIDFLGRKVDVSLNKGFNDYSIIVNPPIGGYTVGATYTLVVKTDIYSKDGKKLRSVAEKKFTVSSSEKAKLNNASIFSVSSTGKNTSYLTFDTSSNDDDKVSSYRVLATETSPSNLTLNDAEKVNKNQYKEIKRVNGVTRYNVDFSPSDLDIEGNKINTHSPYYLYYVLSVPNNDEVYNYNLSEKHDYWRPYNDEYAAKINDVKYLSSNQSTVKFTTSEEDSKNIESYRVIATETSPSYLRLDDAMMAKKGRYKDVKRTDGVNEYSVDFSPKDFDMEGRMINTTSEYYIYYILSVPYDNNCYYDYTLSMNL